MLAQSRPDRRLVQARRGRLCGTTIVSSPMVTGTSSTASWRRFAPVWFAWASSWPAAVVADDAQINRAQTELTSLIVTTIATQAPVAGDLRLLISLYHVTYELERIGDHAAGVARQAARLVDSEIDGRPAGGAGLDRMGELASTILHGVLLALVDLDAPAARSVAAVDDEIDRLYHAYFERTLERMRAEPDWVDSGAQLLFAAKHFERIGDRVTNIAEEVVFLSTGAVEDLNP